MGSIRKRPETATLFLDFRYRGVRCREQTTLKDTTANRRKLQKLLERVEAEITLGTFEYERHFPGSRFAKRFAKRRTIGPDSPIAPSFEDFAGIWIAQARAAWTPSHTHRVQNTLDCHLLPYFRTRSVDEITRSDILDFRAYLVQLPGRACKTLSPQRVNHIMGMLGQIMAAAAERFGCNNPYSGIKALRIPRRDVQPFSLEEVGLILRTVREDFRNYYTVRFFSGLRTGEIDGLKWKYVDFRHRLILVRESIVDGQAATTKTTGSARDVTMSDVVYEALIAQREQTGHHKYVFCRADGTPFSYPVVTRSVWYPLLRHLGLERRNPYQTRHTAASLWLAAGENPEWVARQLGHASTEMLFKRYSRFIPNLTRRDGSAANALINKLIHFEGGMNDGVESQ